MLQVSRFDSCEAASGAAARTDKVFARRGNAPNRLRAPARTRNV